ncbi:MAG: hypothetical protein COA78_33270 [Blastopirellula sp.]|nr:MAG: hypothetical protein COA78_33270 [Blastopirellula sp.]
MQNDRAGKKLLKYTLSAWVVLVMTASLAADVVDDAVVNDARQLYLKGEYAEAQEKLASVEENSSAAALLLSRCLESTGKSQQALEVLNLAIKDLPANEQASLLAEKAKIFFQTGKYDEALKLAKRAMALNENQAQARWIVAEVAREQGDLETAQAGYEWFVDFYNDQDQIEDPDTLYLVGQAAGQFARWSRNSEQFQFLVNTLYPEILAIEPNYWPAEQAMAQLFIEKFNMGSAKKHHNLAIAINGTSAELLTTRAEMALAGYQVEQVLVFSEAALKIRADYVPAMEVQAQAYLADFKPEKAIATLAKASAIDGRRQSVRGLQTAAVLAADGPGVTDEATGELTRLGTLISEQVAENEKCGEYFAALARGCEFLRKYPHAANYFREAVQRMPQLVRVHSELGMTLMRMGEEEEARKVLELAFEIDPFHVRVKNTLAVLDILENYKTIETDHFILRFDADLDGVLGEYVSRFLEEEVYPEVCESLDYEPEEKTLIEIFNKAKNTSGHGWFSARMVGVPSIGTVGACAGKMIAITSPNAINKPFNWAHVLKHEYVHVVNLQQTDFNIPHWFTEAMAVTHESEERPPEWNRLLAQRVAAKDLFNLDTINYGFIRPKDSNDWTMAYCQAYHYSVYLKQRFGDDVIPQMLKSYGNYLTTQQIIEQEFKTTQADIEKGYLEYLEKVVAGINATESKTLDFVELTKAIEKNPEDADLLAQLAYAYLLRKANPVARKYANRALEVDEKQSLAIYVMARLYLSIGDQEKTLELLKQATEGKFEEHAVALLAGLKFKEKAYDEAEKLYAQGAAAQPENEKWQQALLRVYLASGNEEKMLEMLPKLAKKKHHDLLLRKKLADIYLQRQDWNNVVLWATEAIEIDITDIETHVMLAKAHEALKQWHEAGREYEVAMRLNPDDVSWGVESARCYLKIGEIQNAKKVLASVNRLKPGNREAQKLQEEIEE